MRNKSKTMSEDNRQSEQMEAGRLNEGGGGVPSEAGAASGRKTLWNKVYFENVLDIGRWYLGNTILIWIT